MKYERNGALPLPIKQTYTTKYNNQCRHEQVRKCDMSRIKLCNNANYRQFGSAELTLDYYVSQSIKGCSIKILTDQI